VAATAVTVVDFDGEEKVVTGLTASVGAAVYPAHGADRTALLLAADAALYVAKTAGRDCTRVAGAATTRGPLRFAGHHPDQVP
jgi:GGDEF domain-containing protein